MQKGKEAALRKREIKTMPTEKFDQLSEYKRRRILEAMWEEFLEIPYDEIKVSRLTSRAGISRASTYLYFSGKDDWFSAMASWLREELEGWFCHSFVKEKGNYYRAMKELCRRLAEEEEGQRLCLAWQRMMEQPGCRNLALKRESESYGRWLHPEHEAACFQALDRSAYPAASSEELISVINMGFMVISRGFLMKREEQRDQSQILTQLAILDHGIRGGQEVQTT